MLVFAGLAAVLATVGVFISGSSAGSDAAARERVTDEALARAKAALIEYAVTYAQAHDPDTALPGFLPCPDRAPGTRDGVADADEPNCGAVDVNALGRLPWHPLNLPPLRDAAGECLWYAVAGRYKAKLSPKTNEFTAADQSTQRGLFNWHTPGQLNVFGPDATTRITPDNDYDRAVAIVFAPGNALASQNRSGVAGTVECGGNYAAANYLDARSGVDNALIDTTPPGAGAQSSFVQGPPAPSFNDRAVVITARELWSAIWRSPYFQARAAAVTRNVAQCIADYRALTVNTSFDPFQTGPSSPCSPATSPYDERLPWAVPMNAAGIVNSLNYADEADTYVGRVPFATPNSNFATQRCLGTLARERLMGSTAIGGKCSTWTPETDLWYANWKDQLLYAVSSSFRPAGSAGNRWCGTCVSLDQPPVGEFAALVFFAGPPLAGQSRVGATNSQQFSSYLEGVNVAQAASPGAGDFTRVAAASSNDRIVCTIASNMTVSTTCTAP
jgi:hypothetical protein